MRKTKNLGSKAKKRFALVVDGYTEYWYFQILKRNHRDLLVDLKPEIPQHKSLKSQYDKVLELSNIYDKVIWIIDLDVITSETKKTKKGDRPAMDEFKEYHNAVKKHKNIQIIVNNPCLEFWLLLHFEYTSKFFNDCESAEKRLKTYIKDYQKTEKFYTAQNDIFKRLKPNLKNAVGNSAKLKSLSFDNTFIGVSEMSAFFSMPEITGIL